MVIPTLSSWGTKNSLTFSGATLTTPPSGGQFNGTTSATRVVIDKQKPVSGKARRQPDGWRPPTPFRAYVFKATSSGAYRYDGTNFAGAGVIHSGVEGYLPLTTSIYAGSSGTGRFPIDNGSKSRAITECLNKLAAAEINLSESIATLNQTLGMLGGSLLKAAQLAKAMRDLLRGKPSPIVDIILNRTPVGRSGHKTRKRLLGEHAANRWLEYQYGWKPLLSDIYTLTKLASEQAKKEMWITAKRNVESAVDKPLNLFKPANGTLISCDGNIISGAKCRIDAEITSPLLRQFNQLGLVNPALLAWELIPFSFVIDWFLPIGNFLAGFSASFGLTFKGGSVTTYTKTQLTVMWTQYPFLKGKAIKSSLESLTCWRETFSSMPLPRLYLKNPFTSLTRAATALSLLIQQGKR